MGELAIDIQNLGKRYELGQMQPLGVRTLNAVRRIVGRRQPADDPRELWALRDINLQVERGEVVGIVGRNGAGKSTLLKILSRITDPTEGFAELRGRVASLLEVGTGFHPELTGRENIFLNGAILGMSRREVRAKLAEIVEFSGIERFLDTPVKRYSSGMRVRLAFAVAAHLEPEILIIDEVLAVGDAEFQKRCLGKMQDVSRSGRTVLFVSHNMAAVQNLCSRSLLLQGGRVEQVGDTHAVVAAYLRSPAAVDGTAENLAAYRSGNLQSVIRGVELRDEDDRTTRMLFSGRHMSIVVHYEANDDLHNPCFGIGIDSDEGERLAFLQTRLQHGLISRLPRRGMVQCAVPWLPLAPGLYRLSIGCSANRRQLDQLERAIEFEVAPWDAYGTGHLPRPQQGRVLIPANWTFTKGTSELPYPMRQAG